MEAERLRIAMFSTMLTGGAGYAALRVLNALRRLETADPTLYVGEAEFRRFPGVKCLRDAEEGCQPPRVPDMTNFSVNPPGIPEAELKSIIAQSDIFNLHWFARFLSIENIGRLSCSGKPVVLTIRDMNPLTGGCHFFHGCDHWQHACKPCPQWSADELLIPNATLESKKVLWDFDNITVVTMSDHSSQLVKRSPLFDRCRIEKIPNPIDVSIFKPHDRERARTEFGVPRGKRAIAYLPSFSSAVKGSVQAVKMLRLLANDASTKDCVVLCAGELDEKLDVPFETINVGFIGNKRRLSRYYSAADATLIPSLEETFSNTAAESVACGTPVVGFQVGAIPEIAQGLRGRAVPVEDVQALATALSEILSSKMGTASELHAYARETFCAEKVGGLYLRLFEDLSARAQGAELGKRPARVSPQFKPEANDLNQMLHQYRDRRSIEIASEQEVRKKERRSLRGGIRTAGRVWDLFFSDNRAFWQRVWRLVSERR